MLLLTSPTPLSNAARDYVYQAYSDADLGIDTWLF
jgi:hypothetical protein